MRDDPEPLLRLGATARLVLYWTAAVSLCLLLASGGQLAGSALPGWLGEGGDVVGMPGPAWLDHRVAAAVLIVCAIVHVASGRPRHLPLHAQAAAAGFEGDRPPTPAEVRVRLWAAVVWSVLIAIVSGSLIIGAGEIPNLERLLIPLHIVAGCMAFLLFGGIAVVAVLAGAGADPLGDPGPPSPVADVRPPRRATPVVAPDGAGLAQPVGVEGRVLQAAMYLGGCLSFAVGVRLFIASSLGTDPLSAMALGLAGIVDVPGIRVGLVSSAVTVVMLALYWVLARRPPPLSTFATMALVGYLIDLWDALGAGAWVSAGMSPIAQMVVGLFLDAYGSSLIIMSGVGIRVVDLLALAMMGRWRMRLFEAKLLIEGTFVAVALATGGPVGAATVAFVSIVAPFVEPFLLVNRRLLRLPYLGPRDIAGLG